MKHPVQNIIESSQTTIWVCLHSVLHRVLRKEVIYGQVVATVVQDHL